MAQQSMMPPHGLAGSQQVTSPTTERPQTAGDVERGEGRETASTSVIGTQSQQKQSLPVRGQCDFYIGTIAVQTQFLI